MEMNERTKFSFKSGKKGHKNDTALALCINRWLPKYNTLDTDVFRAMVFCMENHIGNLYMKIVTKGKSRIVNYPTMKASRENIKNVDKDII